LARPRVRILLPKVVRAPVKKHSRGMADRLARTKGGNREV
jgi:hypothetical protein